MLISTNFGHAQQATVKEIQIREVQTYELRIQDLDSLSDEATIKEIRASLQDIFDVLPEFDVENSLFTFQSAYSFNRDKVELLLANRGLVLISFSTKRNNLNYEVE